MLIDFQVLLSVSAPSEKGEGAKRCRGAAEEGRKEGRCNGCNEGMGREGQTGKREGKEKHGGKGVSKGKEIRKRKVSEGNGRDLGMKRNKKKKQGLTQRWEWEGKEIKGK